VKCVRTDQGTEYYGLAKYCREQGIIHDMSATYTPEQNGRAERLNRTLIERTRAILHEHNAPKLMWSFAIQVAALLRNCIPCNGHAATPPHQLMFDKKPNVELLRVFGCAVTVHTPRKKRDKLRKTSVQGVFVGYAKHIKAWRVLVPSGYGSWQIIESSNVKFQEDTPGTFSSSIIYIIYSASKEPAIDWFPADENPESAPAAATAPAVVPDVVHTFDLPAEVPPIQRRRP
jgi:hypothetical protein